MSGSKAKFKRSRLLVDPKVQNPLLVRVVFYWVLTLMLMAVMAAVQVGFSSPVTPWNVQVSRLLMAFGPALIASVLILPVLLFDCVRYSNRFAGPMYRMRREMQRLAETGEASRLKFRDGDFWDGLADHFNAIADRVEAGKREGQEHTAEAEEIHA